MTTPKEAAENRLLFAVQYWIVIRALLEFLSPVDHEGPFWSSNQAPPVYCTRWKLHTIPYNVKRQIGKL